MTGVLADLVVLAGGAATRLGPLGAGLPKSMLPVAGLPFLIYPIERIALSTNLARIIICARAGTAHHFDQLGSILKHPVHIIEESHALGTGGAILSALDHARPTDPFLVMNGDVLFNMDGDAVVSAAQKTGAALTALHVPDAARFGTLTVENAQITGFQEKTGANEPGMISAGLYGFTHRALAGFMRGPGSFEYDIAPKLARSGQLSAVLATGAFLDIGMPETYAQAENFLKTATYA